MFSHLDWSIKLGFVILVIAVFTKDCVCASVENEKEAHEIVKLIENSIDTLPRPNQKFSNFLLQEVNLVEGFTQYKWASGEVAFTRNTLDNHLNQLIFPTGKYFGPNVNGTFIVLRRYAGNNTLYYVSAVYLRTDGQKVSVEWATSKLWVPAKSNLAIDLCQGKQCELVEMLTGTCAIAKRTCSNSEMALGSKSRYEALFKKEEKAENLDDQLRDSSRPESEHSGHSRKKRMISDYYKKYETYLRNSTRTRKTSVQRKALRIPSSFDLLEMLVESSENGTDFIFKNRIDRRRRKRKSEFEDGHLEQLVHNLVCMDCHSLGDFFANVEEHEIYSQVLGSGIRKLIQNGQFEKATDGLFGTTLDNKSVPFIGFGNCPYEMKGRRKPVSEDLDDIIDFYLRTLKIDCEIHADLVDTVRNWFKDNNFLEIQSDTLTVAVSLGSPLLKYRMLSSHEYETLFSGLLFSKYTSAYMEESLLNGRKPPKRRAEFHHSQNLTISKEIKFLSRVFLESLEAGRLYLSHHLIKLTDSLARLLKNKFMALFVQNEIRRAEMLRLATNVSTDEGASLLSPQNHDENYNYNDRQQVMALKEFILFGLRPILRSATTASDAFQSFYTLNANRIKYLVDIYNINLD